MSEPDSRAHGEVSHQNMKQSEGTHGGDPMDMSHEHRDHADASHEHMNHMGHEGMSHEHMNHADASHSHTDHMGHMDMSHDHMQMPGGMSMSAHHAGHAALFRRLFWWMLAVSIPVAAFSPMFASLIGYPLPDQAWIGWVSPVLGTVMFIIGGRPFLSGALSELRARTPGMMLLIGMAISVAFLASVGASVGILGTDMDFWWELALLIDIMLLGHWIEMRSLAQAGSALDSLSALLPDTAVLVHGDMLHEVPPSQLVVGDVVLVRPGARIPADGIIREGTAGVDESMITGESRTQLRTVGDTVVAGTVSTDSAIRVQVTAVGEDTALAGIQHLVAQAQATRTRTQRIADRAAGMLFWFALGSALITVVVWTSLGAPADALTRAISVLVIACPHALGLAIPLVVSISTERAARAGILITDRLALERLRDVDVVVFDKTGTLTEGKPALVDIAVADGVQDDQALAWAASAEHESEHPLAQAIIAQAQRRGLHLAPASDFRAEPAQGVTAIVEGKTVSVGGPALLAAEGAEPVAQSLAWSRDAATVLHVLVDGSAVAALKLHDAIRPESLPAIAALHRRGVRVELLTGDTQAAADGVARELGVDHVIAGVRPDGKAQAIAELQQAGHVVAMVGDGVNDAPALAAADVGIAIGAGTDVAISSAGVVLAGSVPRAVDSAIALSHAAVRTMKQNLWWAAGYNLVAVPLAAGVLAPIGFVLPMSVGALLMSASTVIVAGNAQLLRRVNLTTDSASVSKGGK